jgi:hypothetical protein
MEPRKREKKKTVKSERQKNTVWPTNGDNVIKPRFRDNCNSSKYVNSKRQRNSRTRTCHQCYKRISRTTSAACACKKSRPSKSSLKEDAEEMRRRRLPAIGEIMWASIPITHDMHQPKTGTNKRKSETADKKKDGWYSYELLEKKSEKVDTLLLEK